MTTREELLVAMYDVVDEFTNLDPANILRAWPNRTSTPPEEYCVYTVLTPIRRGTNASEFLWDEETQDPGVQTDSVLWNTQVQFDFIGINSLTMAQDFATLSRSAILCEFLESREIEPLFSDEPREMTSTDGSEQYAVRYVVTVTFSYWASVTAPVGWFDNVILNPEVVQ